VIVNVALVNKGALLTPVEMSRIAAAINIQVREHVAPMWNTFANVFSVAPDAKLPLDTWRVYFYDRPRDLNDYGFLGRHVHETERAVPTGYVFVDPIRLHGGSVSEIASHETIEMLVDPWVNLEVRRTLQDNVTELWAREVCDPVQGIGYDIHGVRVADFVYPEYFLDGADGPFDFLHAVKSSFEITSGGYASITRIEGGTVSRRSVYGVEYPAWRKAQRLASRRDARPGVSV
jgi:hypothetical protein